MARRVARSVGWLVLALTIALLTEPACAAGKIELVCKGTMEIHPSKPEPFEGAVILDLDKKNR
jgi:hypothetical protein